jgi:hypothetical protein
MMMILRLIAKRGLLSISAAFNGGGGGGDGGGSKEVEVADFSDIGGSVVIASRLSRRGGDSPIYRTVPPGTRFGGFGHFVSFTIDGFKRNPNVGSTCPIPPNVIFQSSDIGGSVIISTGTGGAG